jgi:mono/diheme cytochrome c family protein
MDFKGALTMFRFLIGVVLGVLLIPAGVYLWFHYGHLPVAVADTPFPDERRITHGALDARIDREAIKTPPIQADEGNLVAGAQIYHDQCASCHGLHGKPSQFAAHMYPDAPPLWEKHHNGPVVGVSDDPPGETYWKVSNGIRLTGMPSYKDILTDTQMWQVSLLLANADKPLPPAAIAILNGTPQQAAPAPAPAAPAAK